MIEVQKILDREVKEARRAVPCRSNLVCPKDTSIYDLDLRGEEVINPKLSDRVVNERTKIVEAMQRHYGGAFLAWFSENVESQREDGAVKPTVVIANEMLLPERREGCLLTVEGLAVAVALYDQKMIDYRGLPQSLLVSSSEVGYSALVNSAQIRNPDAIPSDLVIMGPPVDS